MTGPAVEGAVSGGDALVGVDPYQLAEAVLDMASPMELAKEVSELSFELGRIGLGISSVEIPEKDRRFADPTWRDNPFYHRLAQSYLAWCASVDRLAKRPNSDWRHDNRARYAVDMLTAFAAPTNLLPGNPAALKRAFETGGVSLWRGARNMFTDMIHNGGMPAAVDSSPYTVGENLAATPGAVVYREEMFEILQYTPTTATVGARPLLMVPPQVNKHYFLDLAPGRSLVEYTVGNGVHFFTIVWRNPRSEHGHWTMSDYVEAQLRATDVVREITGSPDLNILGGCAGGLTTALMTAHLAANHDDRVHAAAFVVTMIDTHEPNLLRVLGNDRVRSKIAEDAAAGVVYDKKAVAANFAWLRPNDLVFNYVVNNWLLGNPPPAFDILAWNADATNLSAAFDHDLIELYAENKAATPGELTTLGTPIDLSTIKCDCLVIAGKTDHITPWRPSYLTSQLVGGDCDVIVASAGHIQTIVNPPGKPRASYWYGPGTYPDPDTWLARAERIEGSWWPRWADWIRSRSGEEVPAPAELGSAAHPAGDPAPGWYVREA